jgi:uncharacterized protein (DUF924 family)
MSTSPSGTASFDASDPEGWRSVLAFWFPPGLADADLETHRTMHAWWLRGGATAELPPFAPVLEAAGRGALDHWAATPAGRLALIIVLDQFPRGLHAGTPRAFASDGAALALTREGLENGHYEALDDYWERVFFALPLVHAEGPDHLARAELGVALAEARLDMGAGHLRPIRAFGLDQARRHRDNIARFGRHPHRNDVLGRASTEDEAAFLATGALVHQRRPGAT